MSAPKNVECTVSNSHYFRRLHYQISFKADFMKNSCELVPEALKSEPRLVPPTFFVCQIINENQSNESENVPPSVCSMDYALPMNI